MQFKHALGIVLAAAALQAQAQMSAVAPEIAARVRELGAVINPPETAKLYAPLQPALSPDEVRVERDIPYGSDARHRLDIVRPQRAEMATRAVLVFVHGGGFVAGNKTAPGSPFYDNIMLWAARNNLVGVNLTYRLAPQNPWPAARDDLALALQWTGANIARYGGDPRRVFVVGHSAGAAHVASVLADPASRARIAQAGATLAGAMLLSGVYDLASFPAAPSVKAYYGEDAARYPERSSLAGLLAQETPLMISTAELDPPEFRAQFKRLAEQLCQRGRCPLQLDLPGHSHMSEVYSLGTADRQLADAMAGFMR